MEGTHNRNVEGLKELKKSSIYEVLKRDLVMVRDGDYEQFQEHPCPCLCREGLLKIEFNRKTGIDFFLLELFIYDEHPDENCLFRKEEGGVKLWGYSININKEEHTKIRAFEKQPDRALIEEMGESLLIS